MSTKTEAKYSFNAVHSAIRGLENSPKTIKKAKMTTYPAWKDKNFIRGRFTFYTDDDKIISYFLHVSPKQLKIWLPNNKNTGPDHIIDGDFM